MISTTQAHCYGIEPNREFMHGLGTDPSASTKTERFYVTPLKEKGEDGVYEFVETVEEFTEESFHILTLLYYMLINICKETGRKHVTLIVDGISCDTICGGKTVSFSHFMKE